MKIKLKEFAYSEYENESRYWELHNTQFSNINLIVGKNASGKSRTLNVIKSLSMLLSGQRAVPYETGDWNALLESDDNVSYKYRVKFRDRHVFLEKLTDKSKKTLLKRRASGKGSIYGEKIGQGQDIDFEIDQNILAAHSKNDLTQHSYLSSLNSWAKSVVLFQFGSNRSKEYVGTLNLVRNQNDSVVDVDLSVDRLRIGLDKYKDKYKNLIIDDFKKIGFEITDVGVAPTGEVKIEGLPALVIYVKEKDLKANTMQVQISQGMFRALSLLININYFIVGGHSPTILIDDIGEGLDYQRSSALIQLLIDKANTFDYQLIMTTNDKFVMNKIPIKYWSIINREKNHVHFINYFNSKDKFDEFKYIGLSNFDFFESNLYMDEKDNVKAKKKVIKKKAKKKKVKKKVAKKKKAKKKTYNKK